MDRLTLTSTVRNLAVDGPTLIHDLVRIPCDRILTVHRRNRLQLNGHLSSQTEPRLAASGISSTKSTNGPLRQDRNLVDRQLTMLLR
jgi:hypothetical protein